MGFRIIETMGLVGIFMLVAEQSSASAEYCQEKFGKKAFLSFLPAASNTGLGIEDSIVGNGRVVERFRAPPPTGFRCLVRLLDYHKVECPAGFTVFEKKVPSTICSSKVFPLNDLCSNWQAGRWKGLKEKVCGNERASADPSPGK